MLGGGCTAILKTTDVAATLDWYRRVGFEVRDVFPDDGEPTWCEVSRDGVVLQFLGAETPWPGPPAFTGTLYFHPESVDALFEQIKEHTSSCLGSGGSRMGRSGAWAARPQRVLPHLHGACLARRDQADRDAISSRFMRYRDGRGDDLADIIDMLAMYPEERRKVARLLGEIDAEGKRYRLCSNRIWKASQRVRFGSQDRVAA